MSEEHKAKLGSDFGEDELYSCLRKVKKNSAPGVDGLPYGWYLTFWPEIGPYFTIAVNNLYSVYWHRPDQPMFLGHILENGKTALERPSSEKKRPLNLIWRSVIIG